MTPKFGILKILLDCVLSGRIQDAIIVPMSIGYDKVIESGSYVNELLGNPKQKESLVGILSQANVVNLNLGRIDIRFAKPYSLRHWIEQQLIDRQTPHHSQFNPNQRLDHKAILLRSLGYRVLSDINSVSVIMPTTLIGAVLLTLRGRGVGREEMVRRVAWLRREILMKGGRVADFGGTSTHVIVERAVKVLGDLVMVRKDLLEPIYHATKRYELALYRNPIMHLFLEESIVSAAMYSLVKKGQTHRWIPKAQLYSDVDFLSRLLKLEFIFKPGNMESNTARTLKLLESHDVIEIALPKPTATPTTQFASSTQLGRETAFTTHQNHATEASTKPSPARLSKLSDNEDFSSADFSIKLGDAERAVGRETFDFYCFLLWPFIEAYWLTAAGLFTLLPNSEGGLSESMVLDRITRFGLTLYYEGGVEFLMLI